MRVTKIRAGRYKVETEIGTFIIRGGINYNPDSEFFRRGGFEIWNASNDADCTDLNCWAAGPSSKKVALEFIAEQVAKEVAA
jgi:hypothetical protein